MSFQQGLSGLGAAASALDVIGNNVANSSTVGFKGARANFSDVYAASLGIVGASQVGIGVGVSAIQQQFTQGNLTTTNNPLDLALNGGGFFRMSNAGAITYTRNGQFHLDKEGYIINDQNLRLTGYPAGVNGLISPSNPIELQLSASQISPRATSDSLSGNLTAVINLDSRETVPALSPFNYNNPDTYNFSTALNVFDTLGVAHNLTTYYVLNTPTAPDGGEWTVYATLDGANPQQLPGNLIFDTAGALSTASAQKVLPSWSLTSGAVTPWSPGTIDFTGSTQYGSESSVDRLTQGGYAAGSLVGIGVGKDGVVQGRYSNGQTRNMGQIVLATFADPNGLLNLGNNQWNPTSVSGPELVGAPASGSRGVVQSAAVEDSNVDLTRQLVDMITAQRNYQANAQTIKTQDQIMQTLVNLR
ncbi:MAG TPA: flagellar hook protein FlgE [Accumulibacter sp.]|uniref:flagellar hook protein FlgE n=1 Tax=Accumulibacter sp. TaxID=2053492 RepID=UPI00287A5F95|nr:flagellar hook protein FlgE [Accumulibacter sp.]MDS4056114.1 flagellar hook protein FlgE [Accumulibacter sp.]HMV04003.1 flagellar hook protein FlgE [Accumulibacter sp.]HMW62353.1 flagellar hook protein FlgE [Accumulibacter sp.]HMW78767.1 flagellar hook protein FlgE [Accumulibacter sp.]HMX67585.1 flagellar hook protein FlgE [Accumulibacter sp.]